MSWNKKFGASKPDAGSKFGGFGSGGGFGGFGGASKPDAGSTEAFLKSCVTEEGGDIEVEHFEGLFGGLGLDLASIDPYIFFWKVGVKGCWCATQAELKEGFRANGVQVSKSAKGFSSSNTNKLVAQWKKSLQTDMPAFKEFHTFVFNFIRASQSAKVIHLELEEDTTGQDTLRMVLQLLPTRPKFSIDTLIDYLKQQKKPLNQDHWKQVVRFLTTMNGKCDGYDDAFFPTIFDNLAERCAKQG